MSSSGRTWSSFIMWKEFTSMLHVRQALTSDTVSPKVVKIFITKGDLVMKVIFIDTTESKLIKSVNYLK
jgi:hypothetical protein